MSDASRVGGVPEVSGVKEQFTGGQCLADQSGAAAVLTFTFTNPVSLIYVYVDGGGTSVGGRADPFGGTPAANQGWRCPDQVGTYIPCPPTTTVKIYALAGQTVSVAGESF